MEACISLQVSEIRQIMANAKICITRFTVQKYFIFLISHTIIPKFFNNFAGCKPKRGTQALRTAQRHTGEKNKANDDESYNRLTIRRLPTAVQKVAFWAAKGRVSWRKRPPFGH
jgi:hypothetical protein